MRAFKRAQNFGNTHAPVDLVGGEITPHTHTLNIGAAVFGRTSRGGVPDTAADAFGTATMPVYLLCYENDLLKTDLCVMSAHSCVYAVFFFSLLLLCVALCISYLFCLNTYNSPHSMAAASPIRYI